MRESLTRSHQSDSVPWGAGELKGLLVGLSLSSDGSGRLEHELRYWMQEADKNGSGSIDYQEFCRLLHRWVPGAS